MALDNPELPVVPDSASCFVTVDGIRIHYREVDGPDDAIPAIFTHGGGPGSTGLANRTASSRSRAVPSPEDSASRTSKRRSSPSSITANPV